MPAPASLQRRLEERRGALTDADRRLLRALLDDPTEGAFLSSTELAERAQVNQASAVRLAKRLGFDGYIALRSALRHDVVGRSEPAQRIARRLENAGADILGQLVRGEREALDRIARHVGKADLDRAADALLAARRIYVFAQGNAFALLDLLDRRLRRAGLDAVPLTGAGRELAERLIPLDRRDAVLAVALHATPPGYAALMRESTDRGATTIAIGDALGPLLDPRPDILLAAPRGPESEFQSLTVPMTIANALVLTLAARDRRRALGALDRLGELAQVFDAD